LAVNLLILFSLFTFLIYHSGAAQADNLAVTSNDQTAVTNAPQANPLDQLSSSQIAVQVARMTGIYESTSVSNLADSETAQKTVVPSDSQVINKPTVIATNDAKSNEDIVKYVTQPGDTVSSLAIKFGVTSSSIQGSNGITSDTLPAGKTLTIPPVNGLVYDVKSGDTPTSIAQTYNTNPTQLIAFNDAEISGLKPGEQIVIPNATMPVATLARASSSSSSGYGSNFAFGYGAVYGSNGYDYGYCTWYVAQRRAAVGLPVPSNLGNASTWYPLAQAAGIPTGSAPQPNAVLWFGYGANHVAIVQGVDASGNVTISEMNRVGWGVADTRVIPASQAAGYKYIY